VEAEPETAGCPVVTVGSGSLQRLVGSVAVEVQAPVDPALQRPSLAADQAAV
jgi:hypothetical protein